MIESLNSAAIADDIAAGARVEVRETLARYLKEFPLESARFQILRDQLASGEDLFARSNMTGHITTSAAVLNPEGTKILGVHHHRPGVAHRVVGARQRSDGEPLRPESEGAERTWRGRCLTACSRSRSPSIL